MSIRKILVPLLGAEPDRATLAAASLVAKRFGAHVEAFLTRPNPSDALPYLGEGVSGAIVADILDAAQKAADEASVFAKGLVAEIAERTGLPRTDGVEHPGQAEIRFMEVEGPAVSQVRARARFADLVVFGRSGDGGAIAMPDVLEDTLLSTGRSVLVTPNAAPPEIGQAVLVGWDGSFEASNAIRAALPFLATAARSECLEAGSEGVEDAVGAQLADFFRLHGLAPGHQVLEPAGRSIGEVLLGHAADWGADLLVIGGYGHSRVRELLVGGVTRHVLANARLPLLLAH